MWHKHKYEEKARSFLFRNNNINYLFGLNYNISPTPVTLITFKCFLCKKYKQKTLVRHIY